MKSKCVIMVLSRALNMLDYRIIDHGQRVAYIIYKMLTEENKHHGKELHKMVLLASMHDIGAYKTEEIDSLTNVDNTQVFELKNTLPHSIYGYLFLYNFSILKDCSDAILFHHTSYNKYDSTDCKNKELASKLFLADRIDILLNLGNLKINQNLFFQYRETVFSSNDIDLVIDLEKKYNLTETIKSGAYLSEMEALYDEMEFDNDELLSFYQTLGFIIDFRSEHTVLHNITTVSFSVEIAKLFELSKESVDKIYYGALLHDVGKISTSVLILEKTDKLTDYEYESIKDHVVVSEHILKGCIDDETLQIAIRHHEKLDGSGYPNGLTKKDLTFSQQIVGVADILSALHGSRSYKDPFPAERIKGILTSLASQNKLSKLIVNKVIENYEDLTKIIDVSCSKVIENYNNLKYEYAKLYEKHSNL